MQNPSLLILFPEWRLSNMQFSLNDKVHGFRVDRITDLCDIKAMGYEMTHEKVGPVFLCGFRR